LIFYILASWGLPIIIVVITILIWQFGVNQPLTELYGQRYTGEM
jgi:membrane protein insertase Oxa1/YidC/SpoIIIJ